MTFRGASNLTGTKIFIPRGKINLYNTQQGKYIPTVFLCDMQNPIEISANQKVTVEYEYKNPIIGESKYTLLMPNTIQKIEEITWDTWEVVNNKPVGPVSMNTTPVTLYFILDKPLGAQNEPVELILDIACQTAKGFSNEAEVLSGIAERLYLWLGNQGFIYDGGKFHFDYDSKEFDFSHFYSDHKGNCEDVSCLLQICCNALGINMKLNKISALNNTYSTYPVMPFDNSRYYSSFTIHQVATNNNKVYDANLRFDLFPHFVSGNMMKCEYRAHLLVNQADGDWRAMDFYVKKVK